MNQETENFKKTVEHIHLVQQLLASAQLELAKRALTHDQSKLNSPEWEMFADITQNLEGLTYGSPEYKEQLDKMLGIGLKHHYEHNRHHPEFFESREESKAIEGHLVMIRWAEKHGCVMPDDSYGYANLGKYLNQKQDEYKSSINNMNLFDLLEIILDWIAACKRHKDGDINKSLQINKERFGISDQLNQILENTVKYAKNEFEHLKTQKDLL